MMSTERAYTRGKKASPFRSRHRPLSMRWKRNCRRSRKSAFYGVVIDGEYRACVEVGDDTRSLDLPHWVIRQGRYAMRKIPNWEAHRAEIGPTVGSMLSRTDIDRTRPLIEFYRSQAELRVLAPVR